jgi:hypothetical protein
VLFGERAVGLENQFDCLAEIMPGLLESCPLGIRPGKLLDKGHIAFGDLAIHGRKF